MYPSFDMMVGPTDQARALQLTQCELVQKFYDAINAADRSLTHDEVYKTAEVVAARDAYDGSVTQLVALLGPTALCHQVDTELWECFHNVYKDDVGCRPGAGWTLASVQAYLERRHKEHAAGEDVAAAVRT